jgi:class 3 adenylate cyclase
VADFSIREGTIVDLGEFLSTLGLSQHVKTFADNDIDGAILLDLDENHLKELGLSLGQRIKLLKAIAELRACSGAVATTAARNGPIPATVYADRSEAGERRQLTIMFCDLVGSTQLAARADPEEVREIMRAYQDICAGMIARYGGYLAKFLGDGVLAYFGYPHVHEDAAERAVHAARGIVDAIGRHAGQGSHHHLAVRIGIATGVVVVGQVAAPDGAAELSAIGDTPNVAARLQALAEPNAIVIADSTRRLTRGAFRYLDLGGRQLKGIPDPVRTWQVVGDAVASRFEAAHPAGLSRFVGREQEVALLQSRWEQAVTGEGQAVLLCGEGGIGKSRIAEQLRLRLQDRDHVRVRFQCSPFHVSSPLQPVIAQLESAAGLNAGDDDAVRLGKLEALLAPTSRSLADPVPLLATLLSIPLGDRYVLPPLTSDLLKRRTLEALADQLAALAKIKPVYWLVEDMHWIDPTTHELVGICLDRIRDLRVFALLTYRPEFAPPWGHMPHVTGLMLNRLARRQCLQLVESICEGKALPREVADHIVEKTDGIPLFVEELTKTVLDSGLLVERDGHYALAGPLPPMAIPATLHDTLMARLERLSPVKEVAQIGSVIGREFSYELLASVAQTGADHLKEALSQLAAAELVFVRGEPPDATYVFKHALVQDAAYASLLRAHRQQLHARIAQLLEEKHPDVAIRRPELLARHYEAAGLDDRARDNWSRAGRLALAKSTYAEATNHLSRALALTAKTASSEQRTREEAGLLLDRGIALVALKGPASPEHSKNAEDAITVSAPLGHDRLHFRARWADWMSHSLAGDLPGAGERADVLVSMAGRIGADDLKLQAYHARWTTAFLRGQVAITRDDIEHGLALYDITRHKDHWSMFGAHDPGVCARATGACALWQAGYAERARTVAEDAIRVSDELGHPFSRVIACYYAGFFAISIGDVGAADTHAEATAAVAAEGNMTWAAVVARFIAAWVASRRGDIGRGANEMETIFRNFQESKQRAYLTFLGTLVAGAKLEMGRIEDTLNFLDELQQLSLETHQQMFIPDVHRLRAEALHRLDPKSRRIEEEYQTAAQLARQQGAAALELRAVSGLAGWLAETGRAGEGRTLLQPVFDQFEEGFGTPDLRAAKSLLDALG